MGSTVVTTSTVPLVGVYLVRHTKAGSRATWKGPDEDRPLSATGRKQAERLAKWLSKQGVTQTLSSPYVRCMETLEPTAKRLDLKVEPVEVLAEHGPIPPVLEYLDSLPDDVALCTHGDILMGTIGALILGGLEPSSALDYRKGTTWVLERRKARWTSARAIAPR